MVDSMKNLKKLIAGDSASWHDSPFRDPASLTVYSSDTWSLRYELRGPSQLTAAAVADGDGWRTSIGTAQSAVLQPGAYRWAAYLTRDSERVTIANGTLVVEADLASVVDGIDARSLAEKALADCEAALASFKSSNGKIKSYEIGSRKTEFHSLAELLQLRGFWQRRVNSERARAAVANGGGNPRKLLVRF